MMQVVIMAGGLGLRLRPLTTEIPKPMVPILGKPYLEYQIRYLKKQGFDQILILSGYLGHVIREYFGDGKQFNARIHYSEEETPLGTGGGLLRAKKMLDDKFLIIYGDSFLPVDLRQLLSDFEKENAIGMLAVYDNQGENTTVKNNVRLDSDGLISRYDKKSNDPSLGHVEAGISVFKKDVLSFFPDDRIVSIEEQVFPRLIQKRLLRGWPTAQRFYDIGNPDRLKTIESFLTQNPDLFT